MTGLVLSIGVCGRRIHLSRKAVLLCMTEAKVLGTVLLKVFFLFFTMIEKTKDQGQTIDQNGNV